MKLLQAITIIILSVFFVCCSKSKKDDDNKATLTLQNNSTNPYQIFINGQSAIPMQAGNTTQAVKVPCGSYFVRVRQLDGYVLYPTEKIFEGSAVCGGKVTISFP